MEEPRKGFLSRSFSTIATPITYARDKFRQHVGYDNAMRGWENDDPMSEYPKLRGIKDVFVKHAKRGPLLVVMPTLWAEFARDLVRAAAPSRNSPLLPRHQYSTLEQDLKSFKPSENRKKRLLDSTAMETSRSFSRSSLKILAMYWSKAGLKEASIGVVLGATTLYCTLKSVDVQAAFSYWGRDFNDFLVQAFQTSGSIKEDILDAMKTAYDLNMYDSNLELLKAVLLESNHNLENMNILNALEGVRINSDVMSQLTSEITTQFGDLSLARFAGGQNADLLREIVSALPVPAEHRDKFVTDVTTAIITGADVQQASYTIIEKIQEQFGTIDPDALMRPENAEQAAQVMRDLDTLMSRDIFATTSVANNVDHLKHNIPASFSALLGKFLLFALPAAYTAQHLALRWEAWMTGKMANEWLKYGSAYKIKYEHTNIDNPDQRVSENLSSITNFATDITTDGMQNALTLMAFLPILNSMGDFNPAVLGGPDVTIPYFLTWAAVGYAAFATGILGAISHNLPRLNRELQSSNATFRAGLISVHSQPEQISLTKGEPFEKGILKKMYRKVVDVDVKVINKRMQMMVANSVLGNVGTYVPYMFTVPLGMGAMLTFGQAMQTAGIFRTVESSIEFVKRSIPAFAAFKANVDRVAQHIDAMELAKYETLEREYYKRKIDEAAIHSGHDGSDDHDGQSQNPAQNPAPDL